MTVADENRPWNKNIPPPPPATASSSSTCSSNVKKNIAFDSPCDNNAEKTIRIESCSRPTKTSRKHRNSSFLNRIRLGKGEKEDSVSVAIDDKSRALQGPEQQLSFSSSGTRDIASMKREPGSYKKYTDGQSHDDSCSKNVYPKSKKSDEKKSPMKGIKRFMRKKNHVSLASSSSDGILCEGYSSLTSKQEKDQCENNNKKIDNEKISVKDGARIHFHDYDSSHSFVVKKRKSDEGLPSAQVQVEQTSSVEPTCHCFDEQKIEQRKEQRSVELHEKEHKRLRESLSPDQTVMRSSPSSSSAAELTMPPVENLALYCSENMRSVGTSSSSLAHVSDVVKGDINSSLSSNSPMSMEPDAFSSLYQDDSDDDIDDDEDNYPIHQTVRGIDFGEICKTNLDGVSSPQSRRGYKNDGEDDDCCQLDQEDESDSDQYIDGSDEDDSDASTVVNSLPPARPQKPPPGATKEEQDRFYWELCYGKANDPKKKDAFVKPPIHFSASTKVPTKSCLSAKKTQWTEIANSASKRIALKKSMVAEIVQNDDGTPCNDKGIGGQNTRNAIISSFSTPQGNDNCTPQGNDNCITKGNSDGKKSVKFGELSAAEFESTRPTVELTPLPAERVKEEFGLENKNDESDDDSAEMHQETARNADKLAMWEDDFDSYCEDWDNNDSIISIDDDSDEEKLEAFIPRKRQSRDSARRSRTSMGSGERKIGSSERRSSIFFSKSGGSLLEPEDMNMDSQCALKDSSVENSDKGVSIPSRDSLQFSSPSTNGGSFIRLSHSGSENSKVTPTTEITSSSNILRSVHSEGGASISGIARRHNRYGDECADLIPSQLDYFLKNANGAECNPKDEAQVGAQYQVPSTINCSLVKVGELLQGVQTNFLLEHDISSLLAIEDTVSNIAVDFIDFIQDLEMLYQQSIFRSHQIGGYEVLGILEMALSLLEEVNSSTNDFDERKLFRIIESMNTFFDNSEIEETYSLLSEIALINWLQQEAETLEAAKEWLLHILHFNHREEQRIIQVLSGTTAQNSLMEHVPSRRKEIDHGGVMVQIEEIENDLLKEMKELEIVKQEACILAWKCEFERSKPEEVRRYQLLTTVLSYDCALNRPPLSIQIYHLDGTQTLISWDMAGDASEKGKRDSICTVESIERTAASMMTVPNTNRLRFKATDGRGFVQGLCGLVLSQESEAYKLYTHFLDGVELQKYMKGQFQVEHEMGILTVSDTFQRMNLMALDVLDLEKNSAYKLEVSFQNSLAALQILLKISESCVVELRFSYDLSSKRTLFSVVPTDVSVQTLLGTTAFDTKGILQIARNILNNNLGTNAFILNRTCSAILQSLKARNLG